ETKVNVPPVKIEIKTNSAGQKSTEIKSESGTKVEETSAKEKVDNKEEITSVNKDLKAISEPQLTLRCRPGPKSKKPGYVPPAVISICNAETSIPEDPLKDDVVTKSQPETVQTTTRSRTTRAVAASQLPPDTSVPEKASTPPKTTALPTNKPPTKVATIPPKKNAKAKPPPKANTTKKTPQPPKQPAKPTKEETSTTKKEAPRKRKLMGLIVEDNAILATNDGEAPVRQSRRIAQIKIKEEAERRKEEEMALKQMKATVEKKKKVVDETYSAKSDSDGSEDDSERKLELKKKAKKKAKGANPWQTDSEHDESEASEEEHYESDHKLVFFKSDHEFSPESDIEDESQIVQTKRARTAQKDDEDEIIDDGYACQKCNKHDHPEWILLCDKCDKGYHCSCLIPMLFIIPEGDWFCPPCQQEKLIEILESQLQKLDNDLKEKEQEEIRKQRIEFANISLSNVIPDEEDEDETEYVKPKKVRKRPTTSRRRRKNDASDGSSSSESSRSEKSSSSSSSNSSDNEPIYKLRKRRQANVSYRFNEYDDLINSAIKKEMDNAEGAGNLGRGKDISTIIEADKEEKRIKQMEGDEADEKLVVSTEKETRPAEDANLDDAKPESESNAKHSKSDSDSEPIRKTIKRPPNKKAKKKHRKLNSLDIESEDDGSDDDFRTSSFSEDEEDENFSAESDDSSLDAYRHRKGKKHETRRSVRSRRKRYDDAFINDSDGDDFDVPKTRKKKKKEESDFSDFNENETSDEDAEDVDSEDLCDSTDSNESDRGWRSKKTKKPNQKKQRPVENSNASKPVPKKKVKKVEDAAFRAGIPKSKGKTITDESDDEQVQGKSRRTRGKKLTYLNLLDEFESSDSDGIKPGVKRPDTPPEERAAFIKKQEEIKRMLAEKNTAAAAALAAPKIISDTPDKARRPVDSLSTIPRQIIQNAKALDVDYKKGRESDDTDGFDDDLPDDFDAEGMDEEEIAKMMEEEDFAQQQLKAVGERMRKMKEAELLLSKKKEAAKVAVPSVITPTVPPSTIAKTTVAPSTVAPPTIPPSTIPAHLATPPSVVVPPSSFSPRPAMPLTHLIRPPHSSPLSPSNIPHMQPHAAHHPQHSPHGPPHMPMHSHLPSHGPHPPHHIAVMNQAHSAHQMVRGPPHHLLHPSQHPMQHFNPLNMQRHPMQLTQSPHISPNSQSSHMPLRPMHPGMRSPHHPLQMHPPQMQPHAPPSMVGDFPVDPKLMKLTKSGVEPKKRGRKSKAELQALEQAKTLTPPDPSTSMGPSLVQLPPQPTAQEPIIPTTVLAVQNTRLMDPSELGPPGAGATEVKKRGRRKKFTPLRETLNKAGVEASPGGLEQKTNPILAERLGIQDNRSNLSIATPPQLFSPGTVQPSVITRLPRPPLGSPYGPGGPGQQRFYPPTTGQPPVSLAQSTRIPFSAHGPPPPLTSSPAPPSNGSSATNHYVQSELSRQSSSHPGHFRSPAPAHFSGAPSNYQPAPGMPPIIHRSGLQPIEGASSTPQDYSTPSVPHSYGPSYGTYYPPHHPPNVEHRPPPPTSSTSSAAPTNSSFEQFDNAKNTPPHDRTTPNAYQSPPADEPAPSSSEFSGLVSYFSSQQDDLET
ncbi:Remodeling and spacing factor 1, partial [Pseudolycoriella hygida]